MQPPVSGTTAALPSITSMGTADLNASALNMVPFYVDGISYLETEWTAKTSSGADASEASSQRFRFLF